MHTPRPLLHLLRLLAIALSIAAGPGMSCAAGPAPRSGAVTHPPAPTATRARGLWVWRTSEVLADPAEPQALLDLCRARGLNEVYLSIPGSGPGGGPGGGPPLLQDARLPRLLQALAAAGIRAEALLGQARWYQPAERGALLALIEAVGAWNRAGPGRFTGVHLDIEPHQLLENKGPGNLGFLPDLIATFAAARAAAAAHGLPLSADVPRKLLKASPADWAALTAACPRLLWMLYELPGHADAILRLARRALQRGGAQVVVAVRVPDHGALLPEVLAAVEAGLSPEPGYGGWAIHDYRGLRGGL